jgi:hypothetical protein
MSEQFLYGRTKPELAATPQAELVEQVKNGQARDIVLMAKILISEVGKEKAGQLIRKARYDLYYQKGQEAATKVGNPKDLDSYIGEYILKTPSPLPVWVPEGFFPYRTPNKAIFRTSYYCFEAEAFKRFADKEMLEFLAANYCVHDIAWAQGFNPKITYTMTKSFLLGDKYCEFVMET